MTSTGTPSPDPEHLNIVDIGDDSDCDSDDGSSTSSSSLYSLANFSTAGSTSSLDLTALSVNGGDDHFYEEYDRRYHAYHSRRWPIPNDEQEQDRMQIIDQMMNLMLNGELHITPLSNPHRILDVGTGTGIWACEMAHKFPNARVFGLDLSPIQVSAPENVRWDIDDADERWTYPPNYFSFIHTRELLGGISDWRKFFERSFRHLHPGGWIELQEIPYHIYSDNHETSQNLSIFNGTRLFSESMKAMGYNVSEELSNFREYLSQTGFVDVEETRIQIPIGPWKGTPTEKQIGRYFMLSVMEGAEGFLLVPLNRVLGMDPEEVRRLASDMQKDLLNKRHRLYAYLHIIRGRKPTTDEVLGRSTRPSSSSSTI